MPEKMKLPQFEGQAVRSTAVSVTGKVTDAIAQPVRPLELGESIVVLVTGTVTKVTHQEAENGLVRMHTVKAAEVFEVDEGDADLMVAELRSRTESAIDELLGRKRLEFGEGGDE